MASINVRPTNITDKTVTLETARILAALEAAALKEGSAHESNVRCERNKGRYGWAINGNRCSKQDAANSIASSIEAAAAAPKAEKQKAKAEPNAKGPAKKEQIIEMLRSLIGPPGRVRFEC